MNEDIYDEQYCDICGNLISSDEVDSYSGLCKKCYDNDGEEYFNEED